jgi:integrase
MKLGFICPNVPGHQNPMTALARQLQERQHDVGSFIHQVQQAFLLFLVPRRITLLRIGDIAALRWNNLDLARGELHLSTRKTRQGNDVLPLAASHRRQIELLSNASNEPSAPLHPKAFVLFERQRKTGNPSNQFAELLAASGLRQKKNHKSTGKGRGKRRNLEPLSFHSLRRTVMTFLRQAGVPRGRGPSSNGHDSEAMHELYISVGRAGDGDGCFARDLKVC